MIMNYICKFVFSLCLVGAIEALQVGMSTKTPKVTKHKPKESESLTSLYRVNSTSGTTCILIQTDGLISIRYRNKLKEDAEADLYLPNAPDLESECVESDTETFTMKFKGFIMEILFKKTPGGERWYISNVELRYHTSNSLFEHIDRNDLNVRLTSSAKQSMYFPTPVGKSFECQEQEIIMFAPMESGDMSGHVAKLYLRDLKIQSFMYKQSGTFGPPFQCTATGSYRDEAAPLYLGTALALATLATIGGYSGFRYFKVKNVQYGNMG